MHAPMRVAASTGPHWPSSVSRLIELARSIGNRWGAPKLAQLSHIKPTSVSCAQVQRHRRRQRPLGEGARGDGTGIHDIDYVQSPQPSRKDGVLGRAKSGSGTLRKPCGRGSNRPSQIAADRLTATAWMHVGEAQTPQRAASGSRPTKFRCASRWPIALGGSADRAS